MSAAEPPLASALMWEMPEAADAARHELLGLPSLGWQEIHLCLQAQECRCMRLPGPKAHARAQGAARAESGRVLLSLHQPVMRPAFEASGRGGLFCQTC